MGSYTLLKDARYVLADAVLVPLAHGHGDESLGRFREMGLDAQRNGDPLGPHVLFFRERKVEKDVQAAQHLLRVPCHLAGLGHIEIIIDMRARYRAETARKSIRGFRKAVEGRRGGFQAEIETGQRIVFDPVPRGVGKRHA